LAGKSKYVVAKEVREEAKERVTTQNAKDQLRWNSVSFEPFENCAKPRYKYVAYQELSHDRWAVDQVPKGTPGAVKLRRAKNENTATASFGPVLALRPELKVAPGRLRLIPWEIDPETNRFILRLDLEENIPSPKRTKKASLTDVHPSQLEQL
jgi:hypothetical protein